MLNQCMVGLFLSIPYSWNELQLLIILFLQKVQKKSNKEQNTATTINKNNKKYKVKNAWSIIINSWWNHILCSNKATNIQQKKSLLHQKVKLWTSVYGFLSRLMQSVKCGTGRGITGQFTLDCWNRHMPHTCSDNRKQIVAGKCLSCFDWYAQVKRNKNAKLSAFVLRFFPIHSTQWWLICILLLSEI